MCDTCFVIPSMPNKSKQEKTKSSKKLPISVGISKTTRFCTISILEVIFIFLMTLFYKIIGNKGKTCSPFRSIVLFQITFPNRANLKNFVRHISHISITNHTKKDRARPSAQLMRRTCGDRVNQISRSVLQTMDISGNSWYVDDGTATT